MFFQVSLNVLVNGIEILHISMSLNTNTREIYLLCCDTELFLLCIPVLKYKLVGIFDVALHIYCPGRLL